VRENLRCPPGVVNTRRRPASLQRRSVAGETPSSPLASDRPTQSRSSGFGRLKTYSNLSEGKQPAHSSRWFSPMLGARENSRCPLRQRTHIGPESAFCLGHGTCAVWIRKPPSRVLCPYPTTLVARCQGGKLGSAPDRPPRQPRPRHAVDRRRWPEPGHHQRPEPVRRHRDRASGGRTARLVGIERPNIDGVAVGAVGPGRQRVGRPRDRQEGLKIGPSEDQAARLRHLRYLAGCARIGRQRPSDHLALQVRIGQIGRAGEDPHRGGVIRPGVADLSAQEGRQIPCPWRP
jgi:hypothetical protein